MGGRGPISDEKRCTFIKANGDRCGAARSTGKDLCFRHDPDWASEDKLCTAHISGGYDHRDRAGERCPHLRMQGLTVCRVHGGAAQKAVGRRRVAEEKLMAEVTRLAGRPVENPLTELSLLAGRARALMDVLEGRVQKLLDADDGVDGGEGDGGIRYRGTAGEQIRGEVQLYERAMDRLGRMLVDIGRLNIDERLAKIEQRQVEAVVAAIEAGLSAAGVRDPQQRAIGKSAAARHLRAVN